MRATQLILSAAMAVLSVGAAGDVIEPELNHGAAAPVKNVVLVHGAFVDGSGWKSVYEILERDGHHVNVVQEPLTSLSADVAATKRVLALQDGPTVLVAHSYGGTVITEAGNDPRVVALVYIAAHQPDAGETEAANGKRIRALAHAPLRTDDGYLYLDPAHFHADFAADLPAERANFEAHAQTLTSEDVFTTPVERPAWRTKPSWTLVAGSDRIISPDLERMYAKRARSKTVEVAGASHSVYASRPLEVAALIEQAAEEAARETTTTR